MEHTSSKNMEHTSSKEKIDVDLQPAADSVVNSNENEIANCNEDAENNEQNTSYFTCTKNNPYFRIPMVGWFLLTYTAVSSIPYFGIMSLFTLYLKNHLGLSPNISKIVFHITPLTGWLGGLTGAFVSDNYLGKLKTIFIFGIAYTCVMISLPFVSLSTSVALSVAALIIRSVCSGCFHAPINPFCGDQMPKDNNEMLDVFYSLLYLAVNIGAIIGIYVNPLILEFKCQGRDYCYPAAFGSSAAIFVFSLIFLVFPYKRYINVPNEDRAMTRFLQCIWSALLGWAKATNRDQQSLIDYADSNNYSPEFKTDVKQTLKVVLYFSPIPVFWALFDQQFSSWTLQGERMNESILTAQQLVLLNPLLIVFLIPFYNNILYPIFSKLKILQSSNSRVLVGYLFASGSFIYSGFLQISIAKSFPTPLSPDLYHINIFNAANTLIKIADKNTDEPLIIHSLSYRQFTVDEDKNGINILSEGKETFIAFKNTDCSIGKSCTIVYVNPKCSTMTSANQLDKMWDNSFTTSFLRVVFDNCNNKLGRTSTIETVIDHQYTTLLTATKTDKYRFSNYTSFKKGQKHPLFVRTDENLIKIDTIEEYTLKIMTIYILRNPDGSYKVIRHVQNELNTVSLLWQIPQYVLITIAEVFLSVTLNVFAYQQAPTSLKTLVRSIFALTMVGGNLIVVFAAIFEDVSYEIWQYFGFAIACALAGVLNVVLGHILSFKNECFKA